MHHSTTSKKPVANLPRPLPGYGLPDSREVLLTWAYVSERMEASRAYWVCTLSVESHPHVRPVWGVWVNDTLFFGGGPETRWFRNIRANPQVAVHLEDGDKAVIFEGAATLVEDEELMVKLDDAYEAKYKLRHGPPIWQLHPERVFAWQSMQTMTKFTFA